MLSDLNHVSESDFDEIEDRIRRQAVKLTNLPKALLRNPSPTNPQTPTT